MSIEQLLTAIKSKLSSIKYTLRDYQDEGIRWLLQHELNGNGAILGDDPGLGKTLQALSLTINDKLGEQTLIVLPTSLIKQWQELAESLFSNSEIGLYYGKYKKNFQFSRYKIVITSYGTLISSNHSTGCSEFKNSHSKQLININNSQRKNFLKQLDKDWKQLEPQQKKRWDNIATRKNPEIFTIHWKRVLLDEAHRIKNHKTEGFNKCNQLIADYKWAITGTPIQNSKREIRNLLAFTLQDNSLTIRDIDDLIKTHHLRRTKEKCLSNQLPKIIEERIDVPFATEEERIFYRKVQENIKSAFIQAKNDDNSNMAVMFELLLRLRQTTQHPQLVIDGYRRKWNSSIKNWNNGPSSKHLKLIELLQQQQTHSSIVFCHFTSEMDILQNLLTNNHFEVIRLDGSLNFEQRNVVIEKSKTLVHDYKDGNKDIVFLIQIQTGGVGLNLQHISNVYITSPDWNPCNEIQAIARSYRLGQKHDVYVKRLILNDDKMENDKKNHTTIDQRICSIQQGKLEMIAQVLNDEGYKKLSKKFKLTQTKLKRLIG